MEHTAVKTELDFKLQNYFYFLSKFILEVKISLKNYEIKKSFSPDRTILWDSKWEQLKTDECNSEWSRQVQSIYSIV